MGLSHTISEVKGGICETFPPPIFIDPAEEVTMKFCNGGVAQ